MEPDLSVSLRKLRLPLPVMPAAGTFGFGEEYAALYELSSSLGALVTKTLTLRPRLGNPQPRLWETPCGLLNSIGLENPGLSAFVEEIFPRLLQFRLPIVVSVYGENVEEYGELARRVPREAAGLELNLSCPNVPGKPPVLSAEEIFSRVAAAREAWPGELWAKISPEGEWLSAAQAAEEAGADVVVATNTFRGMALDLERRAPVFSQPCGRPLRPGHQTPLSSHRVRALPGSAHSCNRLRWDQKRQGCPGVHPRWRPRRAGGNRQFLRSLGHPPHPPGNAGLAEKRRLKRA